MLVKELFQEGMLKYGTVLNNFEETMLEECGILNVQLTQGKIGLKVNPDAGIKLHGVQFYSGLQRSYIARTQYEQDKFNLQREESEGYSKLVVQLV